MRVTPVKAVVTCSPKTELVSPSGDSFGTEGHCLNQNLSQPTKVSPYYGIPAPRMVRDKEDLAKLATNVDQHSQFSNEMGQGEVYTRIC